jgi:hypothetical protein
MLTMTQTNRTNQAYKNATLIDMSSFFQTENGVSARSWYPADQDNMSNGNWSNNDVSVTLYSTGLCRLNYSVNSNNRRYNWGVRFLNANREEMLTFEFAPMVIEQLNRTTARPFRLERRFFEIDEAFIRDVVYIQIQNLK